MRRVGVLAATGLAIGAVLVSLAGAAPAAVDLYVSVGVGTSLKDLRGQPNGATVQTKLSFWAGPGLDLINPEAATAAVRFTLPSGISFGGQDLPDSTEGCAATQTTVTCSWHLEPIQGRNSINWGWDLTAAAPGTYVFTAELMESSSVDADSSNNRATLTIVASDAPTTGGGTGGGSGGTGGTASVTASAAKLTPAKPKAGAALKAVVNVSASGAPVRPSDVGCAGKVGTVSLRGIGTARSGTASCLFRTPLSAKGKTVRGTVSFTARGTKFAKRFSARLG